MGLRIGVDLDGVCYNFTGSLREFLVQEKGYDKNDLPETTTWNFFKDDWGLTLKQYLDYCHEGVDAGYVFLYGDAHEGCAEVLQQLKNEGHSIHIVTHRFFGNKSVTNTEEWLKREKIPFDTLTFSKDKTVVPVDIFIEDNLDNYRAILNEGIADVVLMDRPWNQEAGVMNRVYNWWDFRDYVHDEQCYREEIAEEKINSVEESGIILDIAKGLVYGDRNVDYGHPADDYARTSAMWTALLQNKLRDGEKLTAHEAILMMVCVKLSRLTNEPLKRDSIIDVAGYAECYDRVSKRLAGLE